MASGPNYATTELPASAVATPPGIDAAWRRRRLWASTWRRLSRWEYWPIWAIYPPVVIYLFWLSLRHRSLTVFTAVNPGMPAASGLVGMSKSTILEGLAEAGDVIATWTVIQPGKFPQRNAALRLFMADHGLQFPLVLKPDRGERGEGVVIARDTFASEDVLRDCAGPLVAQAYVPGVEFGVFYLRRPGETMGEIFAITQKQDVWVIGDGRRSLEELILADDRAVGMARFFLKKFQNRLAEVPGAGDSVRLSEMGTHCLGALFLDGTGLTTSRLERSIEAISRTYRGFHFGRYDVRAESIEAFQRGEFKVIELNGVTSEATSMYDPKHSVWFGWRTLCEQWRIAFEIGAANRRKGAKVWTPRELWKLWQEHRAA